MDEVCGLSEAIKHVRNSQPSDSLMNASKFEKYLASAADQLRATKTSHTSLVFIVPDGVTRGDLAKIHRMLLQRCKFMRQSNIRRSGLIVSFVLLDPSDYMLEPLERLATTLNRDCVVTGTMVC